MQNKNTPVLLTELFKTPGGSDIKEKPVLINVEAITHVSSGELTPSQIIIGHTTVRPTSIVGLVTGAQIFVSETIPEIATKIRELL